MKKIMKKALSLALALVMIVALTPMTTKAASSSMTGEFWADGDINTVIYDGDEKYVYTWTPEESGDYTFTFFETDWVCSILGPVSADYHAFNTPSGVFTHPFEAGIEYVIEILNTSCAADDINFTVEKGAATAGPVNASTNPEEPADITAAMSGVIPAFSTGYFVITGVNPLYLSYNVFVENAAFGPAAMMSQIGVVGFYPNGEYVGDVSYNYGSVMTEVPTLYQGVLFVAIENNNPMELTVNFDVEGVGGNDGGDNGDDVEPSEPEAVLGGDSVENAVDITETGMLGTIPAGTTQYFCVSGLDAALDYIVYAENTVMGPMAYGAYIDLTTYYVNGEAQGETASNVVSVSNTAVPFCHPLTGSGVVFFAVTNNNLSDLEVQFTVEAEGSEDDGDDDQEEAPLGSYGNPEVIGNGFIDLVVEPETSYWVIWTAEVDGVFTVETTVQGASIGIETVNGSYDYLYVGAETYVSVQVAAGDEVLFYVYPGNRDEITVITSVEEDAILEEEEEEEVQTGEEINEDFYFVYDKLFYGENYLLPMDGYGVTLYEFDPFTTGTYTITVTEGVVGYYGTNVWFPYSGDELTNKVVVNYTDENLMSSIVIGVSNATAPMVTIELTGDVQEEERIPEYTPTVSAPEYTFTENFDDLEYVDVEDLIADKAVLGADGYYHLNSADGPIILVNLRDDILSLANATSTGKVAISIYDEDGNVVKVENCNEVLNAYVASMDTATGLYPLTAELMRIYQVYGEQQKWYTETGFVGGQLELGNAEDAWMFACMYMPNAEIDAPNTGDSTNFVLWFSVLALGLVAIAGSVVMKKREN